MGRVECQASCSMNNCRRRQGHRGGTGKGSQVRAWPMQGLLEGLHVRQATPSLQLGSRVPVPLHTYVLIH